MIGISVQFLLMNALVLSIGLAVLNRLGVRTSVAAAVTMTCVILFAVFIFNAVAASLPLRQAALLSFACFVVPSVTVLAISRANWLSVHPWWLLALGPASYVVALFVGIAVYNVFGSRSGQ